MERPKDLPLIKGEEPGIVIVKETLQETLFVKNLLWKKDKEILWTETQPNGYGGPHQ